MVKTKHRESILPILWAKTIVGARVIIYHLSTPFWRAQNRVWLKRQLHDCHDDESKLLKLEQLTEELKKQYIDLSCRANQQISLQLAISESLAIVEAYVNSCDKNPTDEISRDFFRAKEQILLYARWIMLEDEKDSPLREKIIRKIDRTQLEDINSVEEWRRILFALRKNL